MPPSETNASSQLIIIRHGETEWNVRDVVHGQLDSPLTELGLEQARVTARRLKSFKLDFIYSSDLGRAKTTAEIIGEACGRPVICDPSIKEKSQGIIEGLSWTVIKSRYPEIYAAFRGPKTDPAYLIPDGESEPVFQDRIVRSVNRIFERHPQKRTLIVTHGGAVEAFIRHVLQIPFSAPRRFTLKNLALNRFILKRGGIFIDVLGDCSHLEARSLLPQDIDLMCAD